MYRLFGGRGRLDAFGAPLTTPHFSVHSSAWGHGTAPTPAEAWANQPGALPPGTVVSGIAIKPPADPALIRYPVGFNGVMDALRARMSLGRSRFDRLPTPAEAWANQPGALPPGTRVGGVQSPGQPTAPYTVAHLTPEVPTSSVAALPPVDRPCTFGEGHQRETLDANTSAAPDNVRALRIRDGSSSADHVHEPAAGAESDAQVLRFPVERTQRTSGIGF
ncbi:MAG: hypothetical protein ACXU95_12230 [Isosphaeraceae bacterium]